MQTSTTSVDPIISRFRPRDIAGILDQAFRVYRKHFLTFLAIVAVIHVPLQLAIQGITIALSGSIYGDSNPYSTDFSSPELSSGFGNELLVTILVFVGAILALSLLYGILQYLSQGALTSGVVDSHMDRPVSFGGSYSEMFKHIGPMLGYMGLQILIGVGIFIPVGLPLLLALIPSPNSGGANAAVCLAFCLVIPAFIALIYVFVRLELVIPVIMVENLGPVQAMRRSWALVEGYAWRTLGLLIILSILSSVIAAGPAYFIQGVVAIFTPGDLIIGQIVSGGVTVLTTMLYIPIQLTAMTLYYFDLRVRKEGFDIEAAVSQAYGQYGEYVQWQAQPGYEAGQYGQYGQTQTPDSSAMQPPTLGYGNQQQTQRYSTDYSPNPPADNYGGFTQQDYPQPDGTPQQALGGEEDGEPPSQGRA